MKIKSQKGSIALFVLIALLFYMGFLLLLYANNLNKIQTISEKTDILKGIYERNIDNIDDVYNTEIAKNKKDNVKPIIKDIPTTITVGETKIEDPYVEYGALGGTTKYKAFSRTFSTIGDIVNYVSRNDSYGKQTISITAIGNNNLVTKQDIEIEFICTYIKLEYIESTGTQYIDTALTLNGCNVEIKFKKSGKTNQEQILFGGRSSIVSTSQDFSVWTNESGDKIGFHYGKTDTGYMTCDFITAPVVLKNKGGNFYANDELLISIPEVEMSNSRSVFLFGLHNYNGTLDNRTFIGKIYYFKVWDKDNNLIMHLVPCYRISNNKVGMYDMVSDEFFTNEGTGEFVAGPEVGSTSE